MIIYMQNLSGLHKRVAAKFNYRCIIDFKRYSTLHHIVPRSMGGEDHEENLVPLCQSCHRKVHNTGAINWVRKLTDLRKKRLEQLAVFKN
jgi:5-methylcytosine-specific restriction endonuclease McrA